jgi:uncharacterized protein (DUF2147 family)
LRLFKIAFETNKTGAPLALFALLTSLLLANGSPAQAAPDITGNWRTPAGAVIQIRNCGNAPCGKIVRFKPPKGYTMKTTPDANNKDASKKKRKVLGLKVLWRLKPGSNSWKGRVYDPRRGFSANATVRKKGSAALEVQGCVRVVFNVCEKEVWQRVR